MKTTLVGATCALVTTSMLACGGSKKPAPVAAVAPAPAPLAYSALDRLDFNRLAVRENLPVYWIADANHNKAIDPDEVAALLFYPTVGNWVKDGKFTADFKAAYDRIVAASKPAGEAAGTDEAEAKRRALVQQDLDGGRATLVLSDLRQLPPDHQAFVDHMLAANTIIDHLYETQTGAEQLASLLPGDAASASLFRRNRGPACVTPQVDKNPECTAIPLAPKKLVGVYPKDLQADPNFCAALGKKPNAKLLFNEFTVVTNSNGKLTAVPYSTYFAEPMTAISKELSAAADALTDPKEDALRAYLRAASKSFTDNNWLPSDEAWAKMNAENSRWYVRIAPDEVYWDPCSRKAGFHLTFALINQGSLAWQAKLAPVEQDMENLVAKKTGAPYKARKVTFHLPDFIDIVTNAGDDRTALGATIGESLPNTGKVADQGRGRTVAMANLYGDPDSIATRRQRAMSLFDAATLANLSDEPTPGLLSTILHEACHNLGPHAGYAVKGKTAEEAFGGPIASTLEELKAQTCGNFMIDFLLTHGIIDDTLAKQTYTDTVLWAMGHIAKGMYTPTGERRPYSQLAAVQIGSLLADGVLTWDATAKAANGTDVGAFSLHLDKVVAGWDALLTKVAGIKGRADVKAANELLKTYVDGPIVPQSIIAERFARFPKESFVYAIRR